MAANDHSHIRLGAVPESEGHDYAALAVALKDTSTWFREPSPLQRQRAREIEIARAAIVYYSYERGIDPSWFLEGIEEHFDDIIANAELEQT